MSTIHPPASCVFYKNVAHPPLVKITLNKTQAVVSVIEMYFLGAASLDWDVVGLKIVLTVIYNNNVT